MTTETLLKRLTTAVHDKRLKRFAIAKVCQNYGSENFVLDMHRPSIHTLELLWDILCLEKRNRSHEMKVASVNNSPSSVFSTPSTLTVMESFF